MTTSIVKKAVFPVAGMGTRFLPATKATPKEMLPVVDKPLIQYAVEEAIAAGIEQMIFVTGRNKRAIEDHFDKAYELESELQRTGKIAMLEDLRKAIPRHISFVYIRQNEPLGLGHAVLSALPAIDNEPFAVLLADDFLPHDKDKGEKPFLRTMIEFFGARRHSVLCTREVPLEQTKSYGVAATNAKHELQMIVEKPDPKDAPSRNVIVGRYVFTPRLLDHLRQGKPGRGGEIQLTDSIAALLQDEKISALPLQGEYFDCGDKLGYCKASFAMAMRHRDFGAEFRAFAEDSMKEGVEKVGKIEKAKK